MSRRTKRRRPVNLELHKAKANDKPTHSMAEWRDAYPDRAVTRQEVVRIFDSYAQVMERRFQEQMALLKQVTEGAA